MCLSFSRFAEKAIKFLKPPEFIGNTRFRLTLMYLVVFISSVALLTLAIFTLVKWTLESEMRQQIEVESTLLLFEFKEDGLEELIEEIEERVEKNPSQRQFVYAVYNAQNQAIFNEFHGSTPAEGWHELELRSRAKAAGGERFLVLSRGFDKDFTLVVGKSLGLVAQLASAIWAVFFWAIAAVLVLGFVGGYFLARQLTSRIGVITSVSRLVGEGDFSRRIELDPRGDELDDLARVLNGMLDQIERLMENQRIVTMNIAHDLRTPLARLKNHLHALEAGEQNPEGSQPLERAQQELDTTLKLFDAILRLAELHGGKLRSQFAPVDLKRLIENLAAAYQPPIEDAGHTLFVSTGKRPVLVLGDTQLLTQMLANLLENAMAHGGRALTIRLNLAVSARGAVIQVIDNGCGIDVEDRERMLQPFQKGQSRGYGLGLTMANAIAELHHGTLTLETVDSGFCCTLKLPQKS